MKVSILVVLIFLSMTANAENYIPDEGFIPNQRVAIDVALAILKPIYGHSHIEDQTPFTAELLDGIWCVTGSLGTPTEDGAVFLGGVAELCLEKRSGRVVSVHHGE